MYDKDFAELVKIAAEKLKEDTVYKMLIHSEDYQKESDETQNDLKSDASRLSLYLKSKTAADTSFAILTKSCSLLSRYKLTHSLLFLLIPFGQSY